ncbi:MAG: hypothetical protein FDX30_04455 [Chlorobium sp.]|nr:MAG: hypothetical protein FDX30_04455 [Chlorobium sp.]
MKKRMLSLAAMCAVLSFASPAHAELKIGGDATIRPRLDLPNTTIAGVNTTWKDDMKYTWRVRLKASADLGNGYFFKALLQDETLYKGVVPGWNTVGAYDSGNKDNYTPAFSQFYFGRMMQDSHYMAGRLPLNSLNNPIFDLTMYPIPAYNTTVAAMICAVDVPYFQWNFDRIFAFNYGTKIGDGELNATLCVLDNHSGPTAAYGQYAQGLFNDGYAAHVSYKANLGSVTVEPQALFAITDGAGLVYQNVSPATFGANVTIPIEGKSKLGLSGFYTFCKDSNGSSNGAPKSVDYSGYLLRAKFESGPLMTWIDYNRTTDKTYKGQTNWTGASFTDIKSPYDAVYNNIFVWAQYKIGIYESAAGTFSLTPTVRYRASSFENAINAGTDRSNLLRGELWATVTF